MDTGMSEVGGRFRGRGGYGRGRGGGDGMGRGGGNDLDLKPPPDSYVCHNCGKGGHFIQHCPNRDGKNLRVLALPTGIPEALLVECSMDDPAPKFITKNHKIVKRKVDSSALENMIHFQEKGKLADQEDAVDGPNRFKCIVDGVIAVDALKTPCCKKLVCDACFQKMCEDALESDDPMSCPSCGEGLMMDDVLPAEDERKEILELKSKKRPREGDTEE
ncbi:nucleic acid binding protein [Angomonas deanei]|nr:nucleic acid binding protein [Angomonas deanei]|eukprot:EPY28211.1 nucleic acid binding protein [Angomonas deanei]